MVQKSSIGVHRDPIGSTPSGPQMLLPVGDDIANRSRRTSQKRASPWAFLIVFSAAYVGLHVLYFTIPDQTLRDWVHQRGIAVPAVALVAIASPGEDVTAVDGSLRSSRTTLRIVRGCDGAALAFLLAAAVAALSTRWRMKLAGLVGAAVVAYAINELRVVGLYFAAAYRADWFPLLHDYLIPGVVVLVAGLLFAVWAADPRLFTEQGSALM